jgi:uncharacterized protein involved in exopolysaccharide biosynthesis
MSTPRLPQPTQDSLESPGSALPWQDLIASIYHHRKVVAAIFVLGLGLSVAWTSITPPTYRAKALLMVKDQRAQMTVSPDGRSQQVIGSLEREDDINSLLTLAYQPSLAVAALDAVTPKDQPPAGTYVETNWGVWLQDSLSALRWWIVLIPDRIYRKIHGIPPATDLEKRVQKLQADLLIYPLPGSNLVEVTYASRNPRWASRIVNALTTELITKYTRLHESEDAHRFYQSQRTLLAETLSKAEAALVAFRERVGADLLSVDVAELQSRIAELELEIGAVQSRRAELEAQLNAPDQAIIADASMQDVEAGTVGNPVIAPLKSRLMELNIQRSELLSRYTPTSAAVRDIDRQIAEARRFIEQERATTVDMYRKTARAKIDAGDARLAAINTQIAKHRDTLEKVERVLPEWNRLQNNAQTQKEAYLNYLRKEEEARISSALDESKLVNVAIAAHADVPTEPEGGHKRRILFGAVFSGMLAIGIALLRDWMDPSVKTALQAERLVGLPVLGELPG